MNGGTVDPLEAIARGLARRMAQVRKAEDKLAAFAWREESSIPGRPLEREDHASWVVRALHVSSEGDNQRVLRSLAEEGDASVAQLAEILGVGRPAAVDRVSALVQAGLVVRDLESDRVGLTELGSGVVALVDDLAHRLAEGVSAERET